MRARTVVGFCTFLLVAAAASAADYRLEKKFQLGSGGRLDVRTEAGAVEVVGVEGETATVTVTSDRDDFAQKFEVRFDDSEPGRLEVVVERRGAREWFRFDWGGRTVVEITLPRRTAVEAKSSGGGIDVTGLEGSVRAESSGGAVRVAGITGDVVAESSGGGVEIEDVRGSARLDSSGGSVAARRVSGDVEAGSSGGGVRIEEAGGYVTAASSGGGVRVGFAAGNAKGGDLGSSGGGVTVWLDPTVALAIDAHSSGGGISCDLPVSVRGRLERETLRGELNGGGARLKLRSSGGGISIEAR